VGALLIGLADAIPSSRRAGSFGPARSEALARDRSCSTDILASDPPELSIGLTVLASLTILGPELLGQGQVNVTTGRLYAESELKHSKGHGIKVNATTTYVPTRFLDAKDKDGPLAATTRRADRPRRSSCAARGGPVPAARSNQAQEFRQTSITTSRRRSQVRSRHATHATTGCGGPPRNGLQTFAGNQERKRMPEAPVDSLKMVVLIDPAVVASSPRVAEPYVVRLSSSRARISESG